MEWYHEREANTYARHAKQAAQATRKRRGGGNTAVGESNNELANGLARLQAD